MDSKSQTPEPVSSDDILRVAVELGEAMCRVDPQSAGVVEKKADDMLKAGKSFDEVMKMLEKFHAGVESTLDDPEAEKVRQSMKIPLHKWIEHGAPDASEAPANRPRPARGANAGGLHSLSADRPFWRIADPAEIKMAGMPGI
jgi:hypothetical protein